MITLGIETSCDECGLALIDWERRHAWQVLRSQVDLHKVYGGVVPEIAARDHVEHLPKLLNHLLAESGIAQDQISNVAYTAGPGLIGALLAGSVFACSYASALRIPAIPVHHLEAHLLIGLMGRSVKFPLLVLLVSGGHSQLMYMRGLGDYEMIGQSLDDAAGEAFDKVAKKMGLGYPGGVLIEKMAKVANPAVAPKLPLPLRGQKQYDFSFSGLKTAAVSAWGQSTQDLSAQQGVSYAFQERVVDSFISVLKRAVITYPATGLVIAGGVSANKHLRARLNTELAIEVMAPELSLCTDNGLMVAYCGGLRAHAGEEMFTNEHETQSRWPIESLSAFTTDILQHPLNVSSV